MNALLVFVTENETQLYFLENITNKEKEILEKAHNTCLNTESENEASLLINDALCPNPEYCNNKKWACKWVDKRLELPLTNQTKIDIISILHLAL